MADKRISAKKALESAEIISQYCKEQRACQNCVFRQFGGDAWKCQIQAFELRDVLLNIERKKRNGGYL